MSRLLTPEEMQALLAADQPYVSAPTERFHVVIDAGHAELTPEEIARLEPGAVVTLDRAAGDPVEIVANAVTIARGVLVDVGGRAGVRVVSLANPPARSRRTPS